MFVILSMNLSVSQTRSFVTYQNPQETIKTVLANQSNSYVIKV